MAEFSIPHRIIYGKGTAEHLGRLGGRRLLLVYDSPKIGDYTLKLLYSSDIEVRTYYADDIRSDVTHISEGTKALMEFKPEWILAAGGYRAMDIAKLIRIFYQCPRMTLQDAVHGKAFNIVPDKTKLAALPLFNTEGGEVTCSAYIADDSSGIRGEVRNRRLMPDISIIDPDVLSCSDSTQHGLCVLSTLVLATDAASSVDNICFVRPLALEAISILSGATLAYSSVPESSAPLLYAQCLAGIASANSPPGLCGTLCRSAGIFGAAPLGSWGAAVLPAVIRLSRRPESYIAGAKMLGLSSTASLAEAVCEYADMLGLPLSLSEMGISKNTFLKKLSKVSHDALSKLPAGITEEKEPQKYIEEILRAAYSHGEP